MSQAIQSFEAELKHKLDYKASSKISPDTFLYKSFKFFDLYNNGYLNRSDFFKAIAKCGVVVDTHDMDTVYQHYDLQNDGNIHYKEFISNLLFSEDESSEENSLQMSQSKLQNSKRRQDSNPEHKSDLEGSGLQKSQSNLKHSGVSSKNSHLKESNINRIYSECETYQEVCDSIRKQLRSQGFVAIFQLATDLKKKDLNKTHKINKANLHKVLDYLSESSVSLIMREFNANENGQINYAELIYSLKGQPEELAEEHINRAFHFLDRADEKQISIGNLTSAFKITSSKGELTSAIEKYSEFQGIDDGVFTDEDFIDFFGFIWVCYPDSHEFISFIDRAFFNEDARSTTSSKSNRSREFQKSKSPFEQSRHNQEQKPPQNADFRKNKNTHNIITHEPESPKLDNFSSHEDQRRSTMSRSEMYSEAQKKSSTTSYYIKEVEMIVLRMKKRLASKGTRGYLILEKHLRNADSDQDGLVTLDELRKVIKDLKIDITTNECNLLFDVFDPEATNRVSYSELIHTLKGKMSPERRAYFERVWKSVEVDPETTSFSSIKHALNFRGHPDIQTGRRYDDEVFREIQETLLLIQELNDTPRNEVVSKKDFEEYFECLSLSISEDQLFESILQNFWKMHSSVNIESMYAGSRKMFDYSQQNKKGYLMDHHRTSIKGGSTASNAPFGTSPEPTSYFTEHRKL